MMTHKITVSLGMTTNTVEQSATEATVRAFLTQHALRDNCAVRAPCKVSSVCNSLSPSFTFPKILSWRVLLPLSEVNFTGF